jgi:hypothetical protein
MLALFTLATVTKFGSDDEVPSKKSKQKHGSANGGSSTNPELCLQ